MFHAFGITQQEKKTKILWLSEEEERRADGKNRTKIQINEWVSQNQRTKRNVLNFLLLCDYYWQHCVIQWQPLCLFNRFASICIPCYIFPTNINFAIRIDDICIWKCFVRSYGAPYRYCSVYIYEYLTRVVEKTRKCERKKTHIYRSIFWK